MLNIDDSLARDISVATYTDMSKSDQNQRINLAVDSGQFPEQICEMLREELADKRRKIEKLEEKCRKLEEETHNIEIVFKTFYCIVGAHHLSVNQYITYTSLYLKYNNLIDDFWHSVPENIRWAEKINA